MPTYTFINNENGEVVDKFMSMSEHDQFIKENPHLTQKLSAPPIGDPIRLGITKTPDGFQQLLNNARKKNLHSTIQSRY